MLAKRLWGEGYYVKSKLNPWLFLRPLLLALAATAAWITLSAVGASADSSPSRDSLVGAVGSSLKSASGHISHQAKDVLEPVKTGLNGGLAKAPASTVASLIPSPSLAPVVQDVTGLADRAVQSVPVVGTVVPAGTVPAVVDPVAGAADAALESTVGTLVPVAEQVLAPLDPVLEPVAGAVLPPVTIPSLPALPAVPEPGIPATVDPEVSALPVSASGAVPTDAEPDPAPALAGIAADSTAARGTAASVTAPSAKFISGLATAPAASATDGTEPSVDPVPGNYPVEPAPGAPASTTGGAGSSGGNGPAAPAWFSAYHFQIPAAGQAAARGSLLTAPAPASFDPGSSPD